MKEVQLVKTGPGQFRCAYQNDLDMVQRIKNGSLVHAKISQPRNPAFHRKFMALMNLGFEYFNPIIEVPDYLQGVEPEKNFDEFRQNVTILAGWRDPVVNIRGDVKFVAKSISFAKMDELEFHDLYEKVYGVLWKHVLSQVEGMDRATVDKAVDEMMSFM